ncbi:MAG: preprotein translocase subunit SecA [Acidimicrobiia bacterium]
MGVFQKVLRAGEGRKLKAVQSVVPLVNAHESEMERLDDAALAALTNTYRERFSRGEDLDDLLPEAFATVREAARRVLGQRHYDVQLMGGAGLHFGWVAEMRTGEGKTLVATLPAYLNSLGGGGVHIVTVNDYLAMRDAEWMGQVHRFLGLDVGLIVPDQRDWTVKKRAYDADITYGTNNELGFDYLRDNMAITLEEQAQRGHSFAIVDEVDSILIDEARTPLIISGPADSAQALYYQFAKITRSLQRERDYEVDEAKRTVVPTEEGISRVEEALGVTNLYENVNQNFVHQLQASLKAKELFKRDVDYVVQQGEVMIVDEFTGRILEGRRWSEGLHQSVEAKEGVRIKEENQTLATVTLQNYFRLYDKLSGMTGTAMSEAGEFAHTYNLEVVSIPTHRPTQRLDEPDQIYKSEEAKFSAVADDIAERTAKGQPVLVGTISVEKSERLSRTLQKRGVRHEVLNAKQHSREANIVTQAGRLGSVTVATNMAGRGVDILLGGNPEGLAQADLAAEGLTIEEAQERYSELLAAHKATCAAEGDRVREAGGLFVLGTERHESRRIDNQLRGRSGRQGDPGASRFYLSLEDDLMRLFATGLVTRVMSGLPDDIPIESRMVTKRIEGAQRTVEDRNFEIRKDVLKYDEVMNEQRKIIYRRRQQILDGGDLRDESLKSTQSALDRLIDLHCPEEFAEEWNVTELRLATNQLIPMGLTDEDVRAFDDRDTLRASLNERATKHYEGQEQAVGIERLRDAERRALLAVIDHRWREHLYEMDYLREGINLRAMGQKDPLSEWQHDGFAMFQAMVDLIEDDFVRYISHFEEGQEVEEQSSVDPSAFQYAAPEDPVAGSASISGVAASLEAELAEHGDAEEFAGASSTEHAAPVQAPVRTEKVPGRNEPCFCGSGKKYKLCHGR